MADVSSESYTFGPQAGAVKGQHRDNPIGFVQGKYFKSSFSAMKIQFLPILSDSQQSNPQYTEVLYDSTKNETCCERLKIFLHSLSMASIHLGQKQNGTAKSINREQDTKDVA